AEEEQIVAPRRLERIDGEVERVVTVADPIEVRLRPALVHGDRDQADVRRDPPDQLVDRSRLSVERSVSGVRDRRVDGSAEPGAERAAVVVDDAEVARAR